MQLPTPAIDPVVTVNVDDEDINLARFLADLTQFVTAESLARESVHLPTLRMYKTCECGSLLKAISTHFREDDSVAQ